MPLSEHEIRAIVDSIADELRRGGEARDETATPPADRYGRLTEELGSGDAPETSPPAASTAGSASGTPRMGVFDTVDAAVAAARRARAGIDTLEKRDRIIANQRKRLAEQAESLAEHAVAETGLGRVDSKTLKNRLVIEKTPGTEDLHPEILSGDHGLTLTELAPWGVIGAVTPSTNPSATIINNGISMVAAGNAVVFAAHPMAKDVTNRTIDLMNRASAEVGGPETLLCAVAEPTIETAQALFHHDGVDLLVVTGGGGVVRAAQESDKRVIAAGPGNPPVVVDETADLARAARDIVTGASFDNNVVCTCEKEILAVESIADRL
ncbi:MAG: aldehyde dehydrogenase family protein, partial [Gemmatimonadota bacterium]|nr:aldehyde dehydrogenase family protein [Gemmatimonadota bacterium]